MSDRPVSLPPDPDMQATPAALLRAGRAARDLARQTKTAIVYVKDGVLITDYEMRDFPDDDLPPCPPSPRT